MSASLLDTLRQWAAAERDNDAAELANARALRDEILSAWQQPRQDVPGEIYVVVCANDKPLPAYAKQRLDGWLETQGAK